MARLNSLPWRVLAGVLLTVTGLALGWLWFRDSSFAAVEHVTITGSGSSEQKQVRQALETAASGMSTLNSRRRSALLPTTSIGPRAMPPSYAAGGLVNLKLFGLGTSS